MSVLLMLVVVGVASATPVMRLGDVTAPFATHNTLISTVANGGSIDLYVWASNDIPLAYFPPDDPDNPDGVRPESGLDNAQVFLQYNTTLVNLQTGAISKLVAVTGNPFGTTWSGRTQGTFNSLGFAEGALLPASNADAFEMQKIMKVTFTVATNSPNTTVRMFPNASISHQSFIGNTVAQTQYFGDDLVTFVPEPVTLVLLSLGGLFLRRRHA